jgi:uncharacterized membrane protein YphA (DoxX/SURF4 family)
VTSGFEKAASPYQNFLYVIQSYAFLNPLFEEITAHLLPWFEFFTGVFLALGFWLKGILPAAMSLFVLFMIVVGRAIIRHLPVEECGCLGDLISFPLPVVFVFDTALFILTGLMYYKFKKTQRFSLDYYLLKDEAL